MAIYSIGPFENGKFNEKIRNLMRKLGISLLIISISDNLIFNRIFVMLIKHLDLK